VKGPKGQLSGSFPAVIKAELADGEVKFTRPDDSRQNRSLHGLVRALVNNMVTGVTAGFSKQLEIQGVGYRADMKGKKLALALGFSHPVEVDVPDGLSVSVDGTTNLKIEGIDKQLVGQFAANIRSIRPPEPYKGKGIRYAGEHVRRKVGKTGATA
ncbi:MAG: 50S ribosomal protein L6, partial [bacterium]|nr:50S ribosomal protein L6 [bacterium]